MRGKARPRSSGSPRPRITPAYAGKSKTMVEATAGRKGSPPAYAGKSRRTRLDACNGKDHPRVCGEKGGFESVNDGTARITPAYAGKRDSAQRASGWTADHPRVCGEKLSIWARGSVRRGSPPHMRGKAGAHAHAHDQRGITPAHAGKRVRGIPRTYNERDHPRTCGEKYYSPKTSVSISGSPPHVRGKVRG